MIAGENQVVVGRVPREMPRSLPDRVRGALVPMRIVGCLLRSQDFDEAPAEQIHAVGLADVPVQRGGVELGQDENPAHVRVKTVADRDVDEAIFAADRHGWLRSMFGQGKESSSLTASQNDGKHVAHTGSLVWNDTARRLADPFPCSW